MKKLWSTKKGKLILLGAAAVLIAAAVLFVLRATGEDSYRTIQVYRVDGETEITRGARTIEPYENMMLKSGDGAHTLLEGWLYMLLDGDKYMLAEPETRFTLRASGANEDSKTYIDLESGALVTHITEELGVDSVYEITTPNSAMAVRGTSYRIFVWFDDQGVSYTTLEVFEGVVQVELIYPDGTKSEPRSFYPGESASMYGNVVTSDYIVAPGEIDYVSLSVETLEFLKIGAEEAGEDEYSITVPDIDDIIELKNTFFDVIFMYGNNEFGRQSVQFDHCATEPTLMPAPSGYWDFNFEESIRGETVIYWKNG